MICDCKDWQTSWPQIESSQVMASIHGQQYTGAIFEFCPWCGKELNDAQDMRNTMIEEVKAMNSYVRGKYKDVPTSSDEFAIRKEYSPCDNCSDNPLVNKLASGVCHCILGTKVVY